jgi:chemotaxis protein MotB
MARMLKWLFPATVCFAVAALSVGCVPQEKYNAKVLENSSLGEELTAAQQAQAQAQAEADAYKKELDNTESQLQTDEALNKNLESQTSDLNSQVAALDAKYKDALNSPAKIEWQAGSTTALPAQLSNELSQFAADHPDLVDFDAARGIVKFKSDVTFATGSAELTPEARAVIDKFATILNSPEAGNYELLVVGHTDNVPVTNPETIRAGHKNNWYLSAHRAISVASEMVSQGVSKGRLGVAGYGDQRPVADNSTAEGRKLNRRVEVLILPTRHIGSAITASAVSAPRHVHHVEMNKDSAVESTTPDMNK